jgi:hypothetical protein
VNGAVMLGKRHGGIRIFRYPLDEQEGGKNRVVASVS